MRSMLAETKMLAEIKKWKKVINKNTDAKKKKSVHQEKNDVNLITIDYKYAL